MPKNSSPSDSLPRDSVSSRAPVTLAIIAGGSYLALMVFLWALLQMEAAQASDWVPFLGKFHFLLLHLPIGFLAVALFLEISGWFIKSLRAAGAAITPVLWLSFFGGVGATVCGYLLSHTGRYGEELLSDHRWSGIALVGVTLLTLIMKMRFDSDGATRFGFAYRSLLLLSGGLLAFAAHHGGSLTHGEDFLTKDTPPLLKKLIGQEVPIEDQPKKLNEMKVYHDLIAPVMEAKCWSCHQESKIKGDLRMDTFAHLIAGGESGNESVIPRDPDGSELYYRLVTDDEDEVMPPDGKDPLTPSEIEVVHWWIEKGAAEHATVADYDPDDKMKVILQSLLNASISSGAEKTAAFEP